MSEVYHAQLIIAVLTVTGILSNSNARGEVSHGIAKNIAENVEFDSSFLNLADTGSLDLSRFANGAATLPGIYRTAVYVNGYLIGSEDVRFIARGDNPADKSVYPCLSDSIVKNIPFNYEKLPAKFLQHVGSGPMCLDLSQKIPAAQVNYDSGEQRLDIQIPQLYVLKTARGSVNPGLWDSGIPALVLGYTATGYSSESHGNAYKSFYAGMNAGLNIGAWHLRHNGSYNWIGNGTKKYNTINTYMQRDIPYLHGRLLMGQSNTLGQVFDTLPFSGFQLVSDERMLPESQRGYAPDIYGIARTAAQVTVRQSGQVIYETTVSPGEFLINDLYPTGYGGNLEVTVREADGSERTFLVPYASVAMLLRPGSSRYSITGGKLRSYDLLDEPALYQATYQRGFTNAITGYGGMQASQDYYAIQLGVALGTAVGALAFDATQARTHLGNSNNRDGRHNADNSLSGQSYQVSYSKTINETNTNLTLAAYRFSTGGYMDFMTAMNTRDVVAKGFAPNTIWRARNRFTITASQGLAEGWGQLYVSGSLQNYWNKDDSDKQFQISYSNQYKRLTYGLSANRSYSNYGSPQNNFLLSFSFPLGRNDQTHTPQMRLDLNHDGNGRYGQQATVSGTGGSQSQFSYSASAMHANQDNGSSGSLSGQYRNQINNMSATYSAGKSYHSISGGLNGSIIGHSGGVTFTPYTSETFALVEAKGATGASVSSYPGIHIDPWGYAAVPYLNPYQLNEVSIDPKGSAADVELDNTTQKVAPYSGAVVKLKYSARTGTPILVSAQYQDKPVPFGADVLDRDGNSVGSVGQGGQIYARVEDERGELRVKWGDNPDMQCRVGYRVMPQAKNAAQRQIQRFTSTCQNTRDSRNESTTLAERTDEALKITRD